MRGQHFTLAALLGGTLCVLAGTPGASVAQTTGAPVGPTVAEPLPTLAPTLQRYCLGCHNDRARIADLSLEGVGGVALDTEAPVLEAVLRKLRAGEMPPAGRPRPAPDDAATLVAALASALDAHAAAAPDPGAPAIHRLNRAEYANAVRDLLGLDLDHAEDLPADDSGYGFDNIGDVLTVSPLHIEKYITAARRVSRLAVGTGAARPVVVRYERGRGLGDGAVSELPPNLRGGLVVRHHVGFGGDYVLTVRLRGRRRVGLPPPRLDLRIDGRRVELFDADFDNAEATQGTRRFEVRVPLSAGPHEIAAGLLTEYAHAEATDPRAGDVSVDYVLVGGPYDPDGAGDAESRRDLFVCRPTTVESETACAGRILARVARRAYRRPVGPADLDPLLQLFAEGRADGTRFEDGIEMALVGVLVSPHFLYRAPPVPSGLPPGAVYELSDLDLASRLSFFLWSSLPDEELLGLAEAGRLGDDAVLAGQVRRMLADPRAEALVANFGGQWLHLRNVADWRPDPDRYPVFDDGLRHAFEQETRHFLEHLIRHDRPVLDLLDADYTFVNDRLADFYGIPGVTGGYFRRVSLAGTGRAGVLTQGSVLLVTSYPTRTSPVLRGKWVLENLLGAPPPPPPPDVPELDVEETASAGSLREALERHRANPACAACHARLDPLGFALEGFDAVGARRGGEGGAPVDASGTLPDGTAVDGAWGLRDVLLGRRDEFVEALADRLLTYAIGRGLDHRDRPAVREIRRRTSATDYRMSALVAAIVDSVPFRMRMVPES